MRPTLESGLVGEGEKEEGKEGGRGGEGRREGGRKGRRGREGSRKLEAGKEGENIMMNEDRWIGISYLEGTLSFRKHT